MSDLIIDHTPAIAEPTREELQAELGRSRSLHRESQELNVDLQRKIDNVEGYIRDQADMNGELSDDCKEIAGYLGIRLTKEINGTATISISWTATVPMEFDAEDLEISYTLECDTYDAEDFDWNEDEMTVEGEDS